MFFILISWRAFPWFLVSCKSAELLACSVSKRCLGPAVSDFLLYSLLHTQFKIWYWGYWGRARDCPLCCQFLLKFFLGNYWSSLIKFLVNLSFPFKFSQEILPLSIISIFRESKCLLKFCIFTLLYHFLICLLCSKGLHWIQVIQHERIFLAIRVYLKWHLMNRWYYYLYQHVKSVSW